MKKMILTVALLLAALLLALPAMADDSTPTYEIGEGKTEFLVIVTEVANMDMKINVFVHTNETTLMDALTELDFIEVEKTSWGYLVSSVLGIEATGNSYWSILEHNGSSFEDMSTPIQSRKLRNNDVFAFLLY